MKKEDKSKLGKPEIPVQGTINVPAPGMTNKDGIIVDPFGSWTGVSLDDVYNIPVQDVDDL